MIKFELPKLRSDDQAKNRPWWANSILFWAMGIAALITAVGAIILAPSVALPIIGLLCGGIFFLYGLKYYSSVALILLASSVNGNSNGNGNGDDNGNGHNRRLRALFGNGNGNGNGLRKRNGNGNGNGHRYSGLTNGGLQKLKPDQQPFISIQLPMFNEARVVDRLLQACTNLDYENYEILVADDSSDMTLEHLERWAKHPKVRVSHRINRTGFKGAALKHATEVMHPSSKFVAVFDADFIPPPDILHQFIAYFYGLNDYSNGNGNGNGNGKNGNGLSLVDEKLAVVQGYQWHVLNASENWITRGIRTEFAGSYVVERSTQELTGAMKMISGSVFMIRADVLRAHQWGTSITEDWELTLRLYLNGFKVLYSPFIQAPAEIVSDFKQLARQRMRWAEGHTYNVKKHFFDVFQSPHLSRREKLEFLYYAPYYLTSALFIVGTASWLISDIFLDYSLPFWSAALGWSLVFTNALALILMNLVGLFQERSVRKNWQGLLSFVLLTFLLVPYQAYAALKGLLQPKEGGWHRTRKSGVITETVDRMQLKKRMQVLLPKKKKKPSKPGAAHAIVSRLPEPVRMRIAGRGSRLAIWLVVSAILFALLSRAAKAANAPPGSLIAVGAVLSIPVLVTLITKPRRLAFRLAMLLLSFLTVLGVLGGAIVPVAAAPDVYYLHDNNTSAITPAGKYMNTTAGSLGSTMTFDTAGQNRYWYSDVSYPTGGDDGGIAAGTYTLNMYFNQLPTTSAPQVDAVNSGSTATNTLTISHTTSGSERLMLVGVSINNDSFETVSSITYNSTNLVFVGAVDHQGSGGDDSRVEIWKYENPPTGTYNVVITFSADLQRYAVGGVITFTGVDQTTPLGTFASNYGDGTSASVSVTSATNELALGVMACETCTSMSIDSPSTQQWSVNAGSGNTFGAGGSRAGASPNVTVSATLGSSDHWAAGGISVKPATPTVDITAYVNHTATDGSGATLITSASTTITSSTSNPLALNLGSGSAQTFTSSDPRLIRARVEVTGVTGAGDFVLDYDGTCASSKCSSLDSPVVTVPEWGAAFLILVPFVPYLISLVWRRRRLAAQVISAILAVAVTLAFLANDVEPVVAAPDTHYLHDTNTTGITPSGKYMNTTEGVGGSTMTFDTVSQDAYWYLDFTLPTGGDDSTIAAGSYTLNMYFNQLPSVSAPVVDTISSGNSSINSYTISHTSSGSNRLMLVGVSLNPDDNETVSGVTYNGTSLSLVGTATQNDDARVEIWSLVAPSTGANDVVVTFSDYLRRTAVVGVMTFNGAHQTTPLGTFAGANGGTTGPATVNVTSATNELVFDTLACEDCSARTVGAGQTQRWNYQTNDQGPRTSGAGSTEPGAATVTMSWTMTGADDWAIGAVPIKPSGGSAPTVDAVGSGHPAITSMTISHTTSGSDRLMLVGVSINDEDNESVSSITYNGDSLTFVGTADIGDDGRTEIWQLVAPDVGTYDVVITFNEDIRRVALAGVTTFTGVHQTTPLGTFASATGNSAGPATVNVTSATNELVFDTVTCETCGSLTVGGGQTQRWNINNNTGGPRTYSGGSTEAGAATTTMSWTLGSSDYWAIGAVPIKPADPEVDITVAVHQTDSDGSAATEIVTSSTKTITGSTADPYALDIGSGALQTFTSADPQRLRVHITVDAIRGAADFILDYDGACASSLCSNLDTPVITVPEFALILAPLVLLIPLVVPYVKKRRTGTPTTSTNNDTEAKGVLDHMKERLHLISLGENSEEWRNTNGKSNTS